MVSNDGIKTYQAREHSAGMKTSPLVWSVRHQKAITIWSRLALCHAKFLPGPVNDPNHACHVPLRPGCFSIFFQVLQGICALQRNLNNKILCTWHCHRNTAIPAIKHLIKQNSLDSAMYSARRSSRCVQMCILYVCIVLLFLFHRRMQGINLTQTRGALELHQIDSVLRFDCVEFLHYTFTTYYKLDRLGKMRERYFGMQGDWAWKSATKSDWPDGTHHLLGLQMAAVQLLSKQRQIRSAQLQPHQQPPLSPYHLYLPCQGTRGMIALSPAL